MSTSTVNKYKYIKWGHAHLTSVSTFSKQVQVNKTSTSIDTKSKF